jgi:hypothetical protein
VMALVLSFVTCITMYKCSTAGWGAPFATWICFFPPQHLKTGVLLLLSFRIFWKVLKIQILDCQPPPHPPQTFRFSRPRVGLEVCISKNISNLFWCMTLPRPSYDTLIVSSLRWNSSIGDQGVSHFCVHFYLVLTTLSILPGYMASVTTILVKKKKILKSHVVTKYLFISMWLLEKHKLDIGVMCRNW